MSSDEKGFKKKGWTGGDGKVTDYVASRRCTPYMCMTDAETMWKAREVTYCPLGPAAVAVPAELGRPGTKVERALGWGVELGQ